MRKELALSAAVAAALVNASSVIAAAGGCHDISGTYEQQFVPCDVPALVCVEATLTGDLRGVSRTAVTGFDPVTRVFTGYVTTVRDNGSILTSNIEGVSGANLGFQTITGGNLQFAHATGTIVSVGTSVGTYSGEVCLGDGRG